MLGNLEFIFNCSKRKRIPELYLYYRLRLYGHNRGGYLKGYEFTHNEKYVLLPKLIRYGWVQSFSGGKDKNSPKAYKLTSHRKVATSNQNTQIQVEYGEKEVRNIQLFRAWIVSLAEEYCVTNNWRKQEGKSKVYSNRDKAWVKQQRNGNVLQKHVVKKLKKDSREFLKGRVCNQTISNLLGVSERTVTSWRSAPFGWKSRKRGKDWFKVLDGYNVYFLRDSLSCVYDGCCFMSKDNRPITKDLTVHIAPRIFTTSYCKGFYALG